VPVPEQKKPAAHPVVPLQVIAHAVAVAQANPPQVVGVPGTQVCDEQVAAGTKVTVLPTVVHEAALHAFPHEPQLLAVVIAVSHPAVVLEQSAKPGLEVCTQVPVEQLAVAFVALVHGVPHPPQLVLLLVGVSQPRSALLPGQCAKPVAQELAGIEQARLTQVTPWAVLTFGSVVQL
jgi:hypothetical protein